MTDADRAVLVEALRDHDFPDWAVQEIGDALAPVVERLCDQRAAEAEARGYERGRQELAQYLVSVYDNARAALATGTREVRR